MSEAATKQSRFPDYTPDPEEQAMAIQLLHEDAVHPDEKKMIEGLFHNVIAGAETPPEKYEDAVVLWVAERFGLSPAAVYQTKTSVLSDVLMLSAFFAGEAARTCVPAHVDIPEGMMPEDPEWADDYKRRTPAGRERKEIEKE